MPRSTLAVAVLLVLLVGGLRGDIVHLRGGGTIEGEVERDPETGDIRIVTTRGTVIKSAADVLRVEKRRLPRDEFRLRLEKARKDDLDDLTRLVTWAREKGLDDEKESVCRLVLEIDPNHEMARRELGFTVFENEWIHESELRKKREQLGLVKFRGEWMSREERDHRALELAREEVAGLMESVGSENHVVAEYAARKLLSFSGDHVWELFTPYVESPDETVRIVAIGVLARFPPSSLASGSRARADDLRRKLYTAWLDEESAKVQRALELCLRRFDSEDAFRRSVQTLQTSSDPKALERAERLADRLLLKARVPYLLRALVSLDKGERRQHPAVRRLLVRLFEVDHGFDPTAWADWWRANADRYRDRT